MIRMLKYHIKKYGLHRLINVFVYITMAVMLIIYGMNAFTVFAQTGTRMSQLKIHIKESDEWNFFTGEKLPPRKWYRNGFDDSNWRKGPSGIGYGRGSSRTYLRDMRGIYLTIYARKKFIVSNPSEVSEMTLSIACDGPFIAYMNGIEIIRTNNIHKPTNNNSSLSSPQAEQLDISGFSHELIKGKNVLSVECNNDDINSDNFSFSPDLKIFVK